MDFRAAVAALDTLVATLEREGDERALELLRLVDAVHRPALELIARGELEHPVAEALLAMYDLAPVPERLLVEEALDTVRPYIESHGGEVELLDAADGVVHLRLAGACVGCAGSATTLRRGVEEALREHVPGFRELVAHEPERPQPLLQVQALKRPVFVDAPPPIEDGTLSVVEVDGVRALLAKVDGEVYGFRDGCTVDGRSLEGARLAGTVIVCPWHNCAYDARTGRPVDGGDGGLPVLPVAVDAGAVRVAVNVA